MMKTRLLSFCIAFAAAGTAAADAPKPARVAIAITEKGFEPGNVSVKKATQTTLVFTRKTDKTCAKQVVVHVSKTETIKKDLPLDKPVEITATFPEAGKLSYACGMDMITGVVTVQ